MGQQQYRNLFFLCIINLLLFLFFSSSLSPDIALARAAKIPIASKFNWNISFQIFIYLFIFLPIDLFPFLWQKISTAGEYKLKLQCMEVLQGHQYTAQDNLKIKVSDFVYIKSLEY